MTVPVDPEADLRAALAAIAPPGGWGDDELRYLRYKTDPELRVRLDGPEAKVFRQWRAGAYARPTAKTREAQRWAGWDLGRREHVKRVIALYRDSQLEAIGLDRVARAERLRDMVDSACDAANIILATQVPTPEVEGDHPVAMFGLRAEHSKVLARAAPLFDVARKCLAEIAREVGDREAAQVEVAVTTGEDVDALAALASLVGDSSVDKAEESDK